MHGSVSAMQSVLEAVAMEKPQKVVCCGDLFGGRDVEQISALAQSADSVLYFVRGNNDRYTVCSRLPQFEDNIPMYHFGRTLFFTHGDGYNGWRIPPVLGCGDAIIFGHTHTNSLVFRDGIFVLNVGSCALPRDGLPSYLVLDDVGATLRNFDGKDIYFLPWNAKTA